MAAVSESPYRNHDLDAGRADLRRAAEMTRVICRAPHMRWVISCECRSLFRFYPKVGT